MTRISECSGFSAKEGGGALEQCGVGAGVKERAKDHRQLYWVGKGGEEYWLGRMAGQLARVSTSSRMPVVE